MLGRGAPRERGRPARMLCPALPRPSPPPDSTRYCAVGLLGLATAVHANGSAACLQPPADAPRPPARNVVDFNRQFLPEPVFTEKAPLQLRWNGPGECKKGPLCRESTPKRALARLRFRGAGTERQDRESSRDRFTLSSRSLTPRYQPPPTGRRLAAGGGGAGSAGPERPGRSRRRSLSRRSGCGCCCSGYCRIRSERRGPAPGSSRRLPA